ncbi:hypothetical protein [Streptomyces sp. NPDC099088]|uniref:hypothetical protein n=1 Tax=Streptomyces sp. NPDC099088 TaxID=3366101 RepID=UPI00382B864C
MDIVRAVRGAVSRSFTVAVKLNSADFPRGGFRRRRRTASDRHARTARHRPRRTVRRQLRERPAMTGRAADSGKRRCTTAALRPLRVERTLSFAQAAMLGCSRRVILTPLRMARRRSRYGRRPDIGPGPRCRHSRPQWPPPRRERRQQQFRRPGNGVRWLRRSVRVSNGHQRAVLLRGGWSADLRLLGHRSPGSAGRTP